MLPEILINDANVLSEVCKTKKEKKTYKRNLNML